MPYPATAVANEFINLAKASGKRLTQMQLQKLVYFAYGWHLAITGERLIDERVEAWQWGPVLPSLYQEFKRFGSDPITDPAYTYFAEGNKIGLKPIPLQSDDARKDELAKSIIKRVWDVYGKYSGGQLSEMTHEPNSPWTKTPGKNVRGTDIDDKTIEEYFLALARKDNASKSAS